jgi:hypothetical protein
VRVQVVFVRLAVGAMASITTTLYADGKKGELVQAFKESLGHCEEVTPPLRHCGSDLLGSGKVET